MILLNDFQRQWADTRVDAMAAFEAVGASGWYILGKQVESFERALAAYWKMPNAVGVASGLDAIEIALRALGCRAGDRVLTTPLSAFATTLAIVKLGAIPVFVDCEVHGLIDLEACRRVFESRRDIRFFVPVHLYGHALDSAALGELRERFELRIVEDCAQSIGASRGGVPTGLAGHAAATSFYPTKNLGALGDGGALLTADPAVAAAARCLRDYGQNAKYKHDEIGYNSRLDELQAALLDRVYLPRLESWTARRREIAAAYLAGIQNPGVRPMGAPAGSDSCWHLFPVIVAADRKQAFMAHLRASGVACAEHYPILIPDQAALANSPHELASDCARARAIAHGEVSLPIHPYLTGEECATVIGACNRWAG
ncbi:MAG: DegT/DnrJ/EryC1/StrS family aminotransferase [Bryobacteraceae bacterium]